ncbi:hypothetical protein [Sporosarcina sp. NPDC096371]|uniref:hypothetical protein n=1 Tax=Sporosarcina sp. NPDC096371 TaxID=3364530 RepID=UPI00380D2E9E
MENIRILFGDDMKGHSRRLERIIGSVENQELIASAKSGYEAVDFATFKKPEIVLMDLKNECQVLN